MSIEEKLDKELETILLDVLRVRAKEYKFMCARYKDKRSCKRAEQVLKLFKIIEQELAKYTR